MGAGAGAETLNLADLTVGQAKLDTSNFGTTGSARVKDANFDAVNVKGGHAGLSWGGSEFLGGAGDFRTGGGVTSANADWDIFGSGTAAGKFKDANYGGQLSNAHVNLFGHDIALPDAGAKLNASGGANVDLSHGCRERKPQSWRQQRKLRRL